MRDLKMTKQINDDVWKCLFDYKCQLNLWKSSAKYITEMWALKEKRTIDYGVHSTDEVFFLK